jgi:hypothetical protein
MKQFLRTGTARSLKEHRSFPLAALMVFWNNRLALQEEALHVSSHHIRESIR